MDYRINGVRVSAPTPEKALEAYHSVTGQRAILADVSYFYQPGHFMDADKARKAALKREIAKERERPSQPMGFMVSPATGALVAVA